MYLTMTDAEFNIIQKLRDEANSVKDCFTKYSFQAMAISSALIGLILQYQKENPIVAFGSILVIILNLSVARIGNHKYTTANRIFGYQLHLERTRNITRGMWNEEMRAEIGWEEAMRAWRIVQATIFSELYSVERIYPNKLKDKYLAHDYLWFKPSHNLREETEYYSGSYLRALQLILYIICGLSVIPMAIVVIKYCHAKNIVGIVGGSISLFASSIIVVWRIIKNNARREIIENELLSIHSCGILWQAVIIAHFKAKEKTEKISGNYKKYSEYLSKEAFNLKNSIVDIHGWIEGKNK